MRPWIRTSLPKSISQTYALLFAVLLFITLMAEGNTFISAFPVFALIVIGVYGVNRAGGFHSPVGSYIFFCVLLTGVFGSIVKAYLGELLTKNVPDADHTLYIYLCGTCMMVAMGVLSEHLASKKALLADRLTLEKTSQAVVGCLVVGIGLPYLLYAFVPALATIARQLNIAVPVAILIGVYQRTRATDGRSSFTWPTALAWFYGTQFGLLSYSKESMFSPSLAWVVAAIAGRLKVTLPQIILLAASALGAVMILVPYSQYGRQFRSQTAQDWHVAANVLAHPLELRERVNREEQAQVDLYHWFDRSQGILDRLTTLPIDSALIRQTDLVGPIGLTNLGIYFENIVPHFILPDKPDVRAGNQYAHEIGMLAPEDMTTGISFSPYADAYHQAGWMGVLFIMPAVQLLLFVALRSVVGTIDRSPWALFFILGFAHLAAEGLLVFPVYILSIGMEAIVFTAFVMIYVTPMIGSLMVGPGQRSVIIRRSVTSFARDPKRALEWTPPQTNDAN